VEATRTLVDFTSRLHGLTSHKNVMLVFIDVRNSRKFNRRLPYLKRFDLKAATVMVIVKELYYSISVLLHALQQPF